MQHRPRPSTAFCAGTPLPHRRAGALRFRRATPTCCDRPPESGKRRFAAAAVAAALLSAATIDVVPPPPAHAVGVAPTPINPYARRRAEKAYKEYFQRLEERMEELPLGDLKRVVSTGGGGYSVGYRVAGFAAFVAATVSVLVVHPIDSVKTRLQAGTNADAGGELFSGLYKGVLGNVLKEAPNAAIYLGVYEVIKAALMGTAVTSLFRDLPLLTFLLAGALGDAVGSVVRVPAEVVNKRLQLGLSETFVSALSDIFGTSSGLSSLKEAWVSVLLRDVPFGGIQIMLYELGKQFVHSHIGQWPAIIPTSGLPADIMVGSFVGAFTAFVTTPADVLVTRIALTSGVSTDGEPTPRLSVWDHLGALWQKAGLSALFAGGAQRSAYYFVLSALFFGLYEKTSHLASDIASHPSVITGPLIHARDVVGEQLAVALQLIGPNVAQLPPESFTASLYLILHDLPFLLTLFTIQG